MKLTSSAFEDGGALDTRFGNKYENASPPLAWSDAPAGTQSLALVLVDTHPVARGYVHWMLGDLPAEVHSLDEAATLPAGTLEFKPYAGPFPPSGTHGYEFRLFALDVAALDLPAKSSSDAFLAAVDQQTLEVAVLTGTFTKVK